MILKLVLVTAIFNTVLAIPSANNKTGVDRESLPGLLGENGPSDGSQILHLPSSSTKEQSTSTSATETKGPLLLLTSSQTTSSKTTSESVTVSHSATTKALLSSISQQQTYTPSITATATAATTSMSAAEDKPADSTATSSKTWKVVGVSVIVVTVVGLIILVVTFYDRWTGFLRDVLFGRRKRMSGIEDLVPDWEKRSWEFKTSGDDGNFPAVPSNSLENLVSHKPYPPDNELDNSSHHIARPGPVPVFTNFVTPPDGQDGRPAKSHSYSPMTTGEIQRQNSRAARDAYTAYA